MIRTEAGKHFDPAIVDAFLAIEADFEAVVDSLARKLAGGERRSETAAASGARSSGRWQADRRRPDAGHAAGGPMGGRFARCRQPAPRADRVSR